MWIYRFFLFVLITALSIAQPVSAEETETAATTAVESSTGEPSSPPAPAQPEPAQEAVPTINHVAVEGNQIVSTSTILSKMKSKAGRALVQETVNEDLKRLYATGFFQDIRMDVEELDDGGYVLIVVVDEKPIVRTIDITGNTIIKTDKLREALGVIEGQILDRRAVKKGEEEIRKQYSDKGFRFVRVDSDISIVPGSKEATVTIKVTEGEKFIITDIAIEGNEAFKDKKLLKIFKTKKKKLFSKGIFKQEKFQKDIERLKLFYQQEGYLDVKVDPDFVYNDEANEITIRVKIEEGRHYVTGEIGIEGNHIFPESEIWLSLEMLPGLTYSQFYLFKDVESIRDFYNSRGYMDTRIVPDIELNRDTGKVDVVYKIEEGELSFVEQVRIRGNTKTKDVVIRRELRIRPGERFDGERIKKSKQHLENLGYFEEVTYDTEPVPGTTNRKNIIFRVKEKRTGELSFGGGVSSVDSFVGFAEISQRNFDLYNFPRFTGGGQSLSARARIGSISKDISISFVEPYLFNKPISLGTDVFNITRDDRNTDFEQERLGASITISKLFKDLIRLGTGYTLERVELDEISDDAPLTVRNFEGTNWLSRVRLFSSLDKRDSVFSPKKGFIWTTNFDFVGAFLGGDQDFYLAQTSFTQYWTFFKEHVLEWRTRLGTSDAFGDSDEVPVFDRYYAGGLGSVRGYNYRRVGPIQAGDAVGGETLAVTSLEYTVPLPGLENFRAAAFIDAGHVNEDSYKITTGEFSVSIGPGIKIKTPIGPVAFYYGFPIANKDTEDENGKFEFSLSRGF